MPRPLRHDSFYLIIADHDNGTFTIEGPMADDTLWIAAVAAAQKSGRQVNCFTSGEGQSKDGIAESWQSEHGHKQVERGSIVSPYSN